MLGLTKINYQIIKFCLGNYYIFLLLTTLINITNLTLINLREKYLAVD